MLRSCATSSNAPGRPPVATITLGRLGERCVLRVRHQAAGRRFDAEHEVVERDAVRRDTDARPARQVERLGRHVELYRWRSRQVDLQQAVAGADDEDTATRDEVDAPHRVEPVDEHGGRGRRVGHVDEHDLSVGVGQREL